MHQFLHDAALAFLYLGAAIMAAFMLYIVLWLTFSKDPYRYDD